MDVKHKGCKCPDGFYGETIVTEDHDYNNGRPSIMHHCMKCGIDWAVFDQEFGFQIAKYVKSRKEMQMVAKKFDVSREILIKFTADDVIAPNEEAALGIFQNLIISNACKRDVTQMNKCVEIKPKAKKKKKLTKVKKTTVKKVIKKKKK